MSANFKSLGGSLITEMVECPWCDEEYESDPNVEQDHLIQCKVFQALPVKETTPDGRTFVEYEPGILVERRRKEN